MKKVVLFLILLVVSYSCVDKYDLVAPSFEKEGILFLNSNPQGAKIFLLGTDTKKVTPDSINRLETGDYEITLRMMNYSDTTFNVQVFSGKNR